MEVHHHSHSTPKKWKHYIWEFFMLFIAVFCGFLAENQREHFVEHSREKQFMQSLVEDLETDTAELKRAILRADTVACYSDSVLFYLGKFKNADHIPFWMADYVGKGGQRQILINTDRTSSQLKNSGAMRLIRNKKVTTMILHYWKDIDISEISLDRYMLYRDASRSITFKLWVIPDVYRVSNTDSANHLRVIDKDTKKWDELINLVAISGTIARTTHLNNLIQQLNTANELITLINREYHLK